MVLMVGDVERVRRDAGELLLIEAHPAEFDFILLSSCVFSETSPSSLTYNTHTHTHTLIFTYLIYIYISIISVCARVCVFGRVGVCARGYTIMRRGNPIMTFCRRVN